MGPAAVAHYLMSQEEANGEHTQWSSIYPWDPKQKGGGTPGEQLGESLKKQITPLSRVICDP